MSRELDVLKQLYDFASKRGFRYGLNENYIKDRNALQSLLKQGLAFYKKAHGYRYWLPTKKGRQLLGEAPERDPVDPEFERAAREELKAEAEMERKTQQECERRWQWDAEPEEDRSYGSPERDEPSEEICEERDDARDYEPPDSEIVWLKQEEAKREYAYKMDSYGYEPYENSDVPAEEDYIEEGGEA